MERRADDTERRMLCDDDSRALQAEWKESPSDCTILSIVCVDDDDVNGCFEINIYDDTVLAPACTTYTQGIDLLLS